MTSDYVSKLIIKEEPLQVLPSLAKAIGLEESIFIQQLYFRLRIIRPREDGSRWLRKTIEEWMEEFPWWSDSAIKRIVAKLKEKGVILTRSDLNSFKIDRTLWYSIDHRALDEIILSSGEIEKWSDEIPNPLSENMLSNGMKSHYDHSAKSDDQLVKEKEKKEEAAEGAAATSFQKTAEGRKVSKFVEAYERIWGLPVASPYIGEQIQEWEGRISLAMWEYALQESAKANARHWKYLDKVLDTVERKGIPTQENGHAPSGDSTEAPGPGTRPPGTRQHPDHPGMWINPDGTVEGVVDYNMEDLEKQWEEQDKRQREEYKRQREARERAKKDGTL